MAKKLSGLQKLGVFAGIGCLSIIGVVVIGVIVATMWARATLANLGDTTPQRVERRVTLARGPLTAERAPAGEPAASERIRLTLDLQEGFFTIRPGQPGSELHVEGTYAPGLYELTESDETDPASGVRRATVRFRSKAPAWARFFANIGDGKEGRSPELTVTIPRGTPVDLTLNVAMGRSEIDLGGLMLGDVSVNTAMGEHRIDFQEPVVEAVRHLRLNTSMGNTSVEHLGNARASSITTNGSMGNLTADLGGAWPEGATADVTFEQSMGELIVRVPSDVRLDAEIRNSEGRSDRSQTDTQKPDNPNAPTLRLRVTTSMGNSRVVRY